MTYAEKLREVAQATNAQPGRSLINCRAYNLLTDRQKNAATNRTDILSRKTDRQGVRSYRACVGCMAGIVPHNQGSDYCTKCLRRDRP